MWEGTTLGDLLELQLHRVEDEVKNIVDKSVKEMAIEKVCVLLCVCVFVSTNPMHAVYSTAHPPYYLHLRCWQRLPRRGV